jgi:hypothetical protein
MLVWGFIYCRRRNLLETRQSIWSSAIEQRGQTTRDSQGLLSSGSDISACRHLVPSFLHLVTTLTSRWCSFEHRTAPCVCTWNVYGLRTTLNTHIVRHRNTRVVTTQLPFCVRTVADQHWRFPLIWLVTLSGILLIFVHRGFMYLSNIFRCQSDFYVNITTTWSNVFSHDKVTTDGVRIGNRIYWSLKQVVSSLFKSLSQASVLGHVFTDRCLVAASNGRRSPSSGFPNCPRVSATGFPLLTKLCYDRPSVGQSVLISSPHLGPKARYLLLSGSSGCVHVGRPLVKVRITLRLVVYHQSVLLGAKLLEDHDQRFFFQLNQAVGPRYVASTWSHRKHRFAQLLYCCLRVCCSNRVTATEPLLSNGRVYTVVS